MPKIQQLSPLVADMIAAGEVVERPASAAKELVENSIDAGAKNITVEIENGGMTYLRVTDDGCGMSAEDAETAFLRHATSKLREASDLEGIRTLGFRGEALAAISAVSHIDLMTKTADADFGIALHLDAGTVNERTEVGCPNGTTIIVRDLFYNTPARMKFMKRDTIEAAAVLSSVQRLALAHPEVSIRVLRDGEEQLHTTGDGKLYSAIYAVMGRTAAKEMTEVNSHFERYELTGFVSKPTASRGNRAQQIFFVNGRHIRSKTLTVALEEAYRNRMMVGRFPMCVLHLHLPEHMVDVNVHPAKVEVKFLNEKAVFDCVKYGVQGALDRESGRVEMELHGASRPTAEAPPTVASPAAPLTAAPAKAVKAQPKQGFFRQMSAEDYRAVASVLSEGRTERQKPAQPAAPTQDTLAPITREAIERKAAEKPSAPTEPAAEPTLLTPEKTAPYRIVGEVLDTYIIVEQNREVLFIDKHAAHERILFEKFRAAAEPITSQFLLQPILCKPNREEAALLLENTALLNDCGFEVSDYGDGVLALRRIPAELAADAAVAAIDALAADLLSGRNIDPKELRDTMLHTVACKAAIKGGQHSEALERAALVREVLSREDLKYCPHGRPIVVVMTESRLERQFKRT